MKKAISCTLATTIAVSPINVFANEVFENNDLNIITETQVTSVTGKLEVDINFSIPILNSNNDMNITLTKDEVSEEVLLSSNEGTTSTGKTFKIEKLNSKREPIAQGESISFIRVIFENLELGNYSFDLSAKGYKTVTVPELDITAYSKRVRIGTKENKVAIKYNENTIAKNDLNEYEIYPALFLAGDANGDDVIDMGDYNVVLKNINSEKLDYDFNKDGQLDIADLSFVKSSIGSENGQATDYIEDTDAIINPDKVKIDVPEGTTGNPKDLLADNGSVVGLPPQAKISMDLTSTDELARSIEDKVKMEQIVIKGKTEGDLPSGGSITLDNGEAIPLNSNNTKVRSTRNGEAELVIDLGTQVAVKEISIDVTGNRGNKTISEIAKIEFLNNVYKEIPKPIISIPTIKTLETSTNLHDERMTISWEPQPNVTGYEVKYYKIDKDGKTTGPVKKLQTNKTNMNILDKAIKPYDTFRVSIQSLNGEWSSGYAEDLVGKPENEGGITVGSDKHKELIPYALDATPDNVDENFNLKDEYYGNSDKNIAPNMGSVSDIQVVPISKPEPPKNLKLSEGYKSLSVSWENHIQARDFDIYYRKVGASDQRWIKANHKELGPLEENHEKITNPDKNKLSRSHSYMIEGLDDESSYEIKTTATNHLGTSKMSQGYLGTTKSLNAPKSSNYKLINKPKLAYNEGESPTEAIKDVRYPQFLASQYPNGVDKFAVVDNDYSTHWTSRGGDAMGDGGGPIIEFEQEQSVGGVTFITRPDGDYAFSKPHWGFYGAKPVIKYEDENGNMVTVENTTYNRRTNGNVKQPYHEVMFRDEIKTKKIQVGYKSDSTQANISEIKMHGYDDLEKSIMDLYEEGTFNTKLKENVTQSDIDRLTKQANTMDPESKEYHPNRAILLSEIDSAQKLLTDSASLDKQIKTLDPTITTKNGGVSLGMNNDWQSLGAVARPGKDENGTKKSLIVYMGTNHTNVKVQIGFLQTYGQPNSYIKQPYTLKPGRNEIEIPSIISDNVEKGGQVMVRVEGGNSNTQVKVRIGNAIDIPHLNVNNIVNDETKIDEVKDKIRVYIRELKKYVANLPNMYPKEATATDNTNNIYTYEPSTAVLNNTDIEGDRFTLTVPATQILKGIESGIASNEEAQVERVYNALLAWEQQIQVTYAKKGVYESVDKAPSQEEYEKHKAPQTRMNIKYQRMIMGAAGYASGHHVGIGYASVPAYMQGVPFKFDENQKVTNPNEARLYGDLIAHEIGHVTDIGSRTYDETSNNLTVSLTSSMLNQNPSKPGNIYSALYEKVTSNTLGLSTNRSVVLGMLWQPYLAYEDEDTYKMLFTDNDMDPNNDSYFAKLNRAYRTLTDEEKKNANRDQLLIRLSSKVVGKDLSAFYLSHGMAPNADTIKYVSQFPKEEKSIQYINDEARRQRIAGNATMSSDTKLIASFGNDNQGKQISNNSYVNQDRVPINLSVTKDNDKILGYEIIRNGNPVGFIEKNKDSGMTKYDDIVDNINNRVFTYEAVAYDYNLNKTEKINLGTLKVRHDGSVEKSKLILSTNTIPLEDSDYDKHDNEPNKTLKHLTDNNLSTVYEGKVHEYACSGHGDEGHVHENDAYVVLDANEVRSLVGIKYTAPTTTSKFFKKAKTSKIAIQNFEIQISKDGKKWTKVKEGQFKLDPNNPTETIYFDKEGSTGGNQLNVYNTRFVKLIAKGSTQISAAEIDLIAPPGDNIEIGVASDNINYKNGLGLLKEDFVYQKDNHSTSENEERKIPKGSVVITGEYRGNPAFNVPLVLNENEKHIADKYKGILMAQIPNNGNLEEIAEGNWVYWVEPQYVSQFMDNQQIFAELYRTDTADAQTGGQRLVSDTFKIEVPDELPQISLSGGSTRTTKETQIIEVDSKKIDSISKKR